MAETIEGYRVERSRNNQVSWDILKTHQQQGPSTTFQDSGPLSDPATATDKTNFYKITGVTTPSALEVPYDIGSISLNAPGALLWVKTAHGSERGSEAFVNSVAVDNSGNIIAVGHWRGTINLGDGVARSSTGGNTFDIFIIKYNSQGVVQWAKSMGAFDHDWGFGVAIDSADNVIVVGAWTSHDFSPSIDFGNGQILTASGPNDIQNIFVSKFSSSGTCLWVKNFGSPFSDYGNAVAVDSSDNIFIAGLFVGSIDFGNSTGTLVAAGSGGFDCFLVKLNSFGIAQWSIRFGGTGSADALKSIAVDKDGNVVVAGYFPQTANFGGGDVTASGNNAGFLVKYAGSNGAYVWSKIFQAGSTIGVFNWGVTTDPGNGDVVVSGACASGADFGGGARTTESVFGEAIVGSSAMFLARYSTSGAYLWDKVYGGAYNSVDYGNAVTVDAGGRVTMTGRAQSPISFNGSFPVPGNGQPNIFVLNLTSDGTYRWHKYYVKNGVSGTGWATRFSGGRVVVGGNFAGDPDFGNGIESAGGASQAAFTAVYQI